MERIKEKIITECLINGKKMPYDVCRTIDLESDSISNYENYKYIGSSFIYFLDGNKSESNVLHYFYSKI